MRKILKIVVVWLLLALFPLQSFAAAMRMPCDPIAMALGGSHEAHESIGADERSHDEMLSADMHDHHASVDEQHASSKADGVTHHKASSCNSCGQGCIDTVVLPSPSACLTIISRPASQVHDLDETFSRFVPDGLKRPPRQLYI